MALLAEYVGWQRISVLRSGRNAEEAEGPGMLDPGPPPSHHLCRPVLLLSLEPRMQTFEEALGDGLEEFIFRTKAEEHPLAVRGDQVFPVGPNPVEARAATD